MDGVEADSSPGTDILAAAEAGAATVAEPPLLSDSLIGKKQEINNLIFPIFFFVFVFFSRCF